MTVVLKNFQVIEVSDVLASMLNVKMSFKLSYRIGKISRELERHVEDYNKERDKIIQAHAKKDEKGNFLKPKDENGKELEGQVMLDDVQEFQTKMLALGMEKISIVMPTMITFEDLEKEEGLKIEPARLASLFALLEPQPEEEVVEAVEVEEVN